MEALINRTPYLPLLATTALFLFGGTVLHAQSESPLTTTEHEQASLPPPEDEGDPAVTLDNDSEPLEANGSYDESDEAEAEAEAEYDPDLQSAIEAQQQLAEDFALYKNLLMNGMTAEADVVAKRIVELSIRENGFESSDTAKALTNLAIVQHRNEDYETAQQNYIAAIGIIERVEDRLNAALVNPLRGLGASQLASGRPDLALETFGRAQHVSHVNEGPHNLDQVGIIESLAEIHIYIGEFERAYELQDRIYQLYARKYEKDSEDIIPALYKRAEWQHRLRLYGRERDTYRNIIKIIERNHGKHELSLIRPLTGLANAYLYVGEIDREYHRDSTLTTGEIFVKRAKRIAQEHPDATWQIKENTYLSLADFYVFSDKAGKAQRTYKETWDLLSEDESRLINRYNHLETLVLLQDIYPPKYYGMDDDSGPVDDEEQFQKGKIVTKFMVNTRGRAKNFEIIESFPPGLADMEKDVLREMRRLIYRPRMEEREVVDTQNMTYTHEFFYRESDLEPVEEELSAPPVGDEDEEVADAGG
jgi:tetratricopeptide (TPR) repeat protein